MAMASETDNRNTPGKKCGGLYAGIGAIRDAVSMYSGASE